MSCGCINNKKLDRYIGNMLSLDIMKNMSIDEITNLYRQGYTLEGTEPKTTSQSLSNIESMGYSQECGDIALDINWSSVSQQGGLYLYKESARAFKINPTSRCLDFITFYAIRRIADYDIYVEIRQDDGTGNKPLGTPGSSTGLLTQVLVPYGTIPTSFGNITVDFGLLLPSIGNYWIVLRYPSYSCSNAATPRLELSFHWLNENRRIIHGYSDLYCTPAGCCWYGLNIDVIPIATYKRTYIPPCVAPVISSVTCPSSPINQGSSGNITAYVTTGTGTSPFTYKLYVDDSGPVDTYSTTSQFHTFTHAFNETIATHTYRVDVVDSCVPPKSVTGSCTATIQAALGTITFNVTSAGPLSGVAISVDSTPRGTTDGSGILAVPNLTVGVTHTYIATKIGYNTVNSNTVLDTTAKIVPISMTLTPPPIAINIVPNKTSCTPPCDVSIDITWRNDATTDTIFVPSMKVDNVTISPAPYPSQTLGPGASTTKTFTVLGLAANNHIICPDPN